MKTRIVLLGLVAMIASCGASQSEQDRLIAENKKDEEKLAISKAALAKRNAEFAKLGRQKEVDAELAKPKIIEEESQPDVAASNWDYSERKNEMTGEVSKIATNRSVNTVNFDFPYKGAQHGWLMLIDRTPIFYVEKGQIICNDKCYFLAKFDDGKAEIVSAYKIGDKSTTIRFGELSDTEFLNNLRKSKKLMLEIEVYQNGRPVFTFDTSGLSQK